MDIRMLKKQATGAGQYAFARLALNYYSFYEELLQRKGSPLPEKLMEHAQLFHRLLGRFLDGGQVEAEISELRKLAISQMELLTFYVDCFQNYEYVFNRMERRFCAMPDSGFGDEEFTAMVTQFLMRSKDIAVMNSRIQQVVSQLPVRFTKEKFFSMVRAGLSPYQGSPVRNLRDMLDILKSVSMASFPEHAAQGREELFQTVEHLRQLDYKGMGKEEYEEEAHLVKCSSSLLAQECDLYLMLQELVNDLYLLALAREDWMADLRELETCTEITAGVLRLFQEGCQAPIPDQVSSLLPLLEGRQEAGYERYLRLDLPKWRQEGSLLPEMDEGWIRSRKMDLLMSGSPFVSLDEDEEGQEETVGLSLLDQMAEAWSKDLSESFARSPKPLTRAVMAKILSNLPVFFKSLDEVKAYIQGSLDSCTDLAEKEACKDVLMELMENE